MAETLLHQRISRKWVSRKDFLTYFCTEDEGGDTLFDAWSYFSTIAGMKW